jgi:glyoxalase-like protein
VSAARIDHVVLGVRDLDGAARRLLADFGLGSVFGGHHVGWGTGNVIVPLGSNYVELLGVVDEKQATQSELGRHLLSTVEGGDRLIGWCVAVDPFDESVDRLGLTASEGSRVRPDGTTLRWRSAGLPEAMADPSRPFFISWLVGPALHPGRATVHHPAAPRGLAWVEVNGDEDAIRRRLGPGGEALPVRILPGSPALVAAGIATASGHDIVLR